jgi:hypothetical protein
MGTSQSSKGPLGNVPMVPPWVDDLPLDPEEAPPPQSSPDELPIFADPSQDPAVAAPTTVSPVAPSRRFANARYNTGNFVRTGNQGSMRRGVAQYIRQGYGGVSTFNRRMSGTARTAGRLDAVFRSGQLADGESIRDQVLAAGGDVNIVMDAIVNAVRETDGSQDAEASRRSIRDALSDLLVRFPDADLGELSDPQREFVIERYAAMDVYSRFLLDMQSSVMKKAGDPATGLTRLRQIKSYITEAVAAGFREARGASPTTRSITNLTRAALAEAFRVFEEYL